jgi:hypothetical protein
MRRSAILGAPRTTRSRVYMQKSATFSTLAIHFQKYFVAHDPFPENGMSHGN